MPHSSERDQRSEYKLQRSIRTFERVLAVRCGGDGGAALSEQRFGVLELILVIFMFLSTRDYSLVPSGRSGYMENPLLVHLEQF